MSEPAKALGRHHSTVVIHLLIIVFTIVLVAVAGYFLLHGRTPFTRSQAIEVVDKLLRSEAPTTVSFHTGLVKSTPEENPNDPRYRLLVSLGIIRVVPSDSVAQVSLTAKGTDTLRQIAGVKESTNADGLHAYVVPLAIVQLDDVSRVRMSGHDRAVVEFTWRWEPNKLGEEFDASRLRETTFTGEERAFLIYQDGVRYYHQAPTKATVALVRSDGAWRLSD